MQWIIRGNSYIPATPAQIKELQAQPGSPHVMYACECGHGGLWSAKNLTLSDRGRYIANRNIFYNGEGSECACPPSKLICVMEGN